MPEPFSRKVYLRALPDAQLPARHSPGARRRAAQLQQFLRPLQDLAAARLGSDEPPELLVLGAEDWRRLFSYPYGLPFTRSAQGVRLVVAASYPERLLHRFDEVLLRAGEQGVCAPGDLREFLDLLVGHEWGHAAANLAGLRSRVKWLDEFMATYLFLLALQDAGEEAILRRFLAWAQLGICGSGLERAPLGTFEYPRARQGLGQMLWFQGMFSLRAEALLGRGWGFALELRELLATGGHRGEVARGLVALEPSFREWFAVFGEAAD